ncbi:hypothetical protein D3C87_1256270 [compost metagenome]
MVTGFTARLSAAPRSAPATTRVDHDALPDGNMLATDQLRPCWVPLSGRKSIYAVPSASFTSVMDGISEPRKSASEPLSFTPAVALSKNVAGSGTPLGHSRPCIAVVLFSRVPAPRRLPAGKVTSAPSNVPAAYNRLPAASCTAPANTVPALNVYVSASTP